TNNNTKAYHKGLAYIGIKGWQKGSQIEIYGIRNEEKQNLIISFIQDIVEEDRLKEISIIFKDKAIGFTEDIKELRRIKISA
ncbi:MAG: hypothetical protein KAG98_06190, partial [Lentisphaeria bacterium]|nr:hypothetical protein [Lentisphaeria bacterium]